MSMSMSMALGRVNMSLPWASGGGVEIGVRSLIVSQIKQIKLVLDFENSINLPQQPQKTLCYISSQERWVST